MKPCRQHPHVEAVIAFLRRIGATVVRAIMQRRIVIEWQLGHRYGFVVMPSAPKHPDACARRACAHVRQKLGAAGVLA